MKRSALGNNIDSQTRKCLRDGRFRGRMGVGLLARYGNLVFMFGAVALMVTVVLGVYRLPGSISTEAKITAGSAIADSEIPAISEVTAWERCRGQGSRQDQAQRAGPPLRQHV